MATTKQVIYPFDDGFIDRSMVKNNTLTGPLFSVTPQAGQVS
jgi:hypothetical protein